MAFHIPDESARAYARTVAGHPFRFYFRDYGLQGQEDESFTLRFVGHTGPSAEDDEPAGVYWHREPSEPVAQALAEHGGEPSFWFKRWGTPLVDGGAAALVLFEPRQFSKRELAWVSGSGTGSVSRTGVALNEVVAGPDGAVWSRLGPKFLRFPAGAAVPDLEIPMRHAGPFLPLGGDAALIVEDETRLVRLEHVDGKWARRSELEQPEVSTMMAVPGVEEALALAVDSSEHSVWVIYGAGDSMRRSEPVQWPVRAVGHLGERVYIRDPEGQVFELCNTLLGSRRASPH